MAFANYSDPKKFGPGVWLCLHSLALNSTTLELQRAYCHYVRVICDNIRCSTCRTHFREYIETHPPERHIGQDLDRNGYCKHLFRWSWKLHNSVNERTGKEILDFPLCYEFFGRKKIERCPNGVCDHTPDMHQDAHDNHGNHGGYAYRDAFREEGHAVQNIHRDEGKGRRPIIKPLNNNGIKLASRY